MGRIRLHRNMDSILRAKYDDISKLEKIDDGIFNDICLHVDYCDHEIDRRLEEIAKLDKEILDLTKDGNNTRGLSYLLDEKRKIIVEMDRLKTLASELQPLYADLANRRPGILDARKEVTQCVDNISMLESNVKELQRLRDGRMMVVKNIVKKMSEIESMCSIMTIITIYLSHIGR
jgi:hypothetical protein